MCLSAYYFVDIFTVCGKMGLYEVLFITLWPAKIVHVPLGLYKNNPRRRYLKG